MIRTYEVEGEWVIADEGGWLPGIYPSEAEAIKAAEEAGS